MEQITTQATQTEITTLNSTKVKIIISPYDDLFSSSFGIKPYEIERYKYRYDLSDCIETVEGSDFNGIKWLIVRKSGKREEMVRMSRITALIR